MDLKDLTYLESVWQELKAAASIPKSRLAGAEAILARERAIHEDRYFKSAKALVSAIHDEWGFSPEEVVWAGNDGSYIVFPKNTFPGANYRREGLVEDWTG